jgi:Zn-dependent peptidase ImmA (M78 family)
MPISELRKIEAMMNVFRFNLIRLLRGIEISTENRFVRYDVDEYGGPEECARITRRQWGLPMGPVQSVIGAIESAGAIIYKWSFETRLLDSISQITPGVPPIIFANADIPTDRLRFTLMHEVGHIVMHQLPSDEMEKQADRFAAEFLMPSEEIRPYLKRLSLHKLPPLKTQWKVSMAALIKRAHDIQEITDRQYRTLFTQLSMNGWKTKEPVIIQEEAPTVFRDILNIHVNEHKYSITELSKIANAKESHFKNYLEETNYSGEYRIVG